jgi:phospholipid/cholesterol/gamma-HCH transport system ATP-binding protein
MPILSIEHLKKRFGAQTVLDDVSFEVEKGEIVSVIGESGGGKSVILKHIIGLIIPDGGRIFFNDKEICSPTFKSSDFDKIRKHFGMLFQGAALFDSKNVGDNISFPLREHMKLTEEEIDVIVADALEKVGLQKAFAAKMPSELSGGMRSRVGLARALVMKPDVMLYDEPTSALDPIMTDKINDLIVSLRDRLRMTSIVVTHDIASAYKVADKMAMLYQGKIIFIGTPAEIRASRNPYIQQFLRSQRKHHYAVEEEDSYQQQVDLKQLRQRTMGDRRARMLQSESAEAGPDSAAGLPDEASFRTALAGEIVRCASTNAAVAVVACGVDAADRIRIDFGEIFGGMVSAEVVRRFEANIRGTDLAGSLEGAAAALALTEVDPETVARGIERMRQSACDITLTTPGGQEFRPTVSCGIALLGRHGGDADALIAEAHAALRDAQHQGGNRTCVAP